ncbi:MAG: alkaline phosphatase family protein, partial [Deltaproteobacteria bacterium]|nr:alkaline phosphatase family protein [Deltaproteobacteria bacterium]MBW2140776.1 alkaline phosphatase family protein [Deltaproteobacteria bacterium]MBW2323656.1 alkaline phosphatase family protein [Deltaproteobacteria bacterium]
LESVILNVPMTYPARPLSGIMVSGFLAVNIERSGYPAWVIQYLYEIGYKLEADFEAVHQDRQAFLDELDFILMKRANLLERFWPEDWDLFFLAITDTDRLNHFFYQEYEDGGAIYQYYLDYYRRVDEIVGRIYDLSSNLAGQGAEDLCLIMLSDHGFTGVKEEFHLNRWLKAHGFQKQVGPEAKVLALDPTRLYFNQPSRFPMGRVGSAETQDLTARLKSSLEAEPSVDEVIPRAEIYSGKAMNLAPDMVIKPAQGFEFKAKFTPGPVYSSSPLQGTHIREDTFYLVHDFSGRVKDLAIRDILDLAKFMFARFNLELKDGGL